VVDALTEQVLAKAALLGLEHVAQALELVVAAPGDRAATPAVVDQAVDGFLQHPLFVADDDLGCAKIEKPLEPVVPVDDAPVQVVQVARGEAAAVELDHRTEARRQHGKHLEDHPLRLVPRLLERLDHVEALGGLLAALTAGGEDLGLELLTKRVEVEPLEHAQHRFGAHAGLEDVAEQVRELAVARLGKEDDAVVADRVDEVLEVADALAVLLFDFGANLVLAIDELAVLVADVRAGFFFGVPDIDLDLGLELLSLLIERGEALVAFALDAAEDGLRDLHAGFDDDDVGEGDLLVERLTEGSFGLFKAALDGGLEGIARELPLGFDGLLPLADGLFHLLGGGV